MLKEIVAAAALLAPVSPAALLAPYQPPATVYGRGHRGVDFSATVRQQVTAPLAGVVSFAGRVNDRGVVSIRSGNTVVSIEPVDATVVVDQRVDVGQLIGVTGTGGHCSLRCVHLGVRVDGAYVDPLVSRRRLLPY